MQSSFLRLGWRDAVKGFVVAAITVVLGGLYTSVEAGSLPSAAQLQTLGLAAGIAYLLKNFLTNSEDKILTKEPEKSVNP